MTIAEPSEIARNRRVERADALIERVGGTRQREALKGWTDLARKGPVERRDLGATFFGRTLQYVALVEVLEDGADYRHLIEGREVVRYFGRSERQAFSTVYAADHLARLRVFLETVRLTKAPNLRRFSTRSLVGEVLDFSLLALPTTDGAGAVGHIAAVFDFPDPLGKVPTAPLSIHSAWWRLERGTERDTVLGDRHWR